MVEEEALGFLREKLAEGILDFKVPQPRRAFVLVKPGLHRNAISLLLEKFRRMGISTITGTDTRIEIELNYHIRCDGAVITIKTRVPKDKPEIETITDLVPGATLYEREVYDLFGVVFKGHKNLKRLLLPENWPEGFYPLRKDWTPPVEGDLTPGNPPPSKDGPALQGINSTVSVVVGPQHPALHEPERFLFKVDGEVVVDVEPRLGYVHRGIEKAAERLMFFQDVHLVERICGICNTAHATCFCQAVESIGNVQIPPRARYLRTMMAELNRIHSHLLLMGVAGLELGFESLFQYAWRDREPVLDVIEMVTGNRIMSEFNTIGGVRRDLNPDVAERIGRVLGKLRKRIEFYQHVFEEDPTIRLRTEGVGVLKKTDAMKLCVVGPVARGSGIKMDIRKDDPYAAYGEIPFKLVSYKEGDCWARLEVRVDEVIESIDVINYALEHLPGGAYRVRVPRRQPEGEAVSRVEAPRGELLHYVKSNGTTRPDRVKVRSPTLANILSLRSMIRGSYIADIPAVLVSLDPCFSCTDRMAFVDVETSRRWIWSLKDIKTKEKM